MTQTPITIVPGQTFKMSVTWADGSTPPVPISLTGYRAHMQFRKHPGAKGDPIVDLTSVGGGALTIQPDGSVGEVRIRISALITALILKDCAYDLFVLKDADSTEATRLVGGPVTVDPSVTVETAP